MKHGWCLSCVPDTVTKWTTRNKLLLAYGNVIVINLFVLIFIINIEYNYCFDEGIRVLLSLDAAMEFNKTNKFFILEITGWCMKNILFPKASASKSQDYKVMGLVVILMSQQSGQ
ncbi:hypothetical protein F8M41_001960 [Gigaspora margarita]|uniref:Uncharacterized protein n=1 Tax=Gigaspora margarita TaxID=4874 RepID=A0A8H3XEB7_GIGMA|nr:hypothetical protein F8M41_001960 [Gigaspora margarita]